MISTLTYTTTAYRWDPLSYLAVLVVTYFNMLLTWDLIKNKAALFDAIFITPWGIGLLTTLIVLHALTQTLYKHLISAFSALIASTLILILIALCFSYIYASSGICDINNEPSNCIYYSIAVMTPLSEPMISQGINTTLYAAWQSILSLFLMLVLVAQFITFTQNYKRIKMVSRLAV